MRALLAAVAILALACHGESEEERNQKSIASWRATLALLAASWSRQAVPDAYAKLVAKRAEEELQSLHADDAAKRARALGDAVEHHDRAAAAALAKS